VTLATLYKNRISDLSQFLDSVGEEYWSTRLASWVGELECAESGTQSLVSKEHVARTKKAMGGMGSVGDIVITHLNGLGKSYPESELPNLNKKLKSMVSQLYNTASALQRG
jgi:hypothetical protein